MSSEGLPVDGVVGTDIVLGARSTQQATDEAKSSLSADSAAQSADAAFKFSRQALSAATDAKEAAENAQNIADANTYYTSPTDPDGTIAGIAGTPDGKMFRVAIKSTESNGVIFNYYRNSAGVAVFINSTPDANSVNELKEFVADYFQLNEATADLLVEMVDEDLFSVWKLFNNGAFGTIKSLLSPNGVFLDDLKITHVGAQAGINYQDADDFVVKIVGQDGVVAPNALQGHGVFSTLATSAAWLRLEDTDGFYRDYIDIEGNLIGGGGSASEFDLVAHDAQNKAYSIVTTLTFSALSVDCRTS
ncbi:TPA: hypothetical protein ACX137_002877 [Serratia marcescens]